MKLKSLFLEVARWAVVLAVVIYLVVLLGGNTVSNADFADVSQAVTGEVDTTNMQQAENRMVKRLYGLDPGAYEGCVLYYPASNMDAEELLIIKLADVSQQEEVTSAIESRIQAQKNAFDGYGVEQFDLLSNYCVVQVQGNYVLFVVSRSCDAALAAFQDAL